MQLADTAGIVTRAYRYDAFGVEREPEPGDQNPFRYCAEYFDKETGSVYLRARYYNPKLGRFKTQDPIRNGLNWYTYCGNDPICFIDPSGLFSQTVDLTYRIEKNKYGQDIRVPNNIYEPEHKSSATSSSSTAPFSATPIGWIGGAMLIDWGIQNAPVIADKAEQMANLIWALIILALMGGQKEIGINIPIGTLGNSLITDIVDTASDVAIQAILQGQAIQARDTAIAALGAYSNTQRNDVTTVAAGYNKKTQQIAVGINRTSANHGAICAEDIVVEQLGGIENINDIVMTSAIRPRNLEIVPVCKRCQSKYPVSSFMPGTPFE